MLFISLIQIIIIINLVIVLIGDDVSLVLPESGDCRI